MTTNKTILDYIDSIGLYPYENEYGEHRDAFRNGYKPSVIDKDDAFSCAYCDYDGYFEWNYPGTNTIGADNGAHILTTEEEVCEFIRAVSELPAIH